MERDLEVSILVFTEMAASSFGSIAQFLGKDCSEVSTNWCDVFAVFTRGSFT